MVISGSMLENFCPDMKNDQHYADADKISICSGLELAIVMNSAYKKQRNRITFEAFVTQVAVRVLLYYIEHYHYLRLEEINFSRIIEKAKNFVTVFL